MLVTETEIDAINKQLLKPRTELSIRNEQLKMMSGYQTSNTQ